VQVLARAESSPARGPGPAIHDDADVPGWRCTQSVFITARSDCTVSETPPAGCTLSSIDPVTTEVESPIVYPVTVTNNCDPAVEAAAAVVEVPRFTG
jgi:hypothetical protein